MSVAVAPDYPLIDNYFEGGIEEHGWVPVEHVATSDAAAAWLRTRAAEHVEAVISEGYDLVATGERSWHREASCGVCEGDGGEHGEPRPRPACDACGGSGRQTQDEGDGIAWEPCEPGDEGAVEFWDIVVRRATE